MQPVQRAVNGHRHLLLPYSRSSSVYVFQAKRGEQVADQDLRLPPPAHPALKIDTMTFIGISPSPKSPSQLQAETFCQAATSSRTAVTTASSMCQRDNLRQSSERLPIKQAPRCLVSHTPRTMTSSPTCPGLTRPSGLSPPRTIFKPLQYRGFLPHLLPFARPHAHR